VDTEGIIKLLKKLDIYAEHADCGGEFKISDALLFDGTKPSPGSFNKIFISRSGRLFF